MCEARVATTAPFKMVARAPWPTVTLPLMITGAGSWTCNSPLDGSTVTDARSTSESIKAWFGAGVTSSASSCDSSWHAGGEQLIVGAAALEPALQPASVTISANSERRIMGR